LFKRSPNLTIIDIHTHAFPDKVASKAIQTLEAMYDTKTFSDGTTAGLLAHMLDSEVDISVVLAVSTAARQVVSINTWISSLYQVTRESILGPSSESGSTAFPYPFIGFGTIHPEFEGYRDEIQRMKELGIKGVKFQPDFQEFYPDDERMFPIYEELIKAGLIILFHIGDEITPVPIIYSTPQRIARVLDSMKSEIDNYGYRGQVEDGNRNTVKIVAAHLGGHRMWDQVEEYLLGRDLYFGASYVFGHLDTGRALKIILNHGTDRILFGSDFPFARQKKDIEAISGLDMTQEEKEKLLGRNAAQLLGLPCSWPSGGRK